jgi:alpha-1,2-mannosyltransferase
MTAPAPSSAPLRQPRQRLTLLTRCLILFVPLVCLAVNLLLPRIPGQPRVETALGYANFWLGATVRALGDEFAIAGEDSWKPMRMGRDWFAEPRTGLLYQEVFFERGAKLQYPPSSLLLLDGLGMLPGNWTSNFVLNGISWVAALLTMVLSVWILDRTARGPPAPARLTTGERVVRAVLAGMAAFTFYPLLFGFYLGQVQTWIDALVAGLVLAWVAGRPALSGALAGVVCLIKPQLGLLVVWGVLRGQRRFVFGWLSVVVVGGTLSLGLYGLANHIDYLEVLSYLGRHGESFHHNQSVNGLVHRLLGNGNNLKWSDGFPPFDARVYAATLASSLLLLGGALLWRRREAAAAPSIDLAIVVTSVTIASPIAWTHHYAVLLPLFALALPAALGAGRERRLLTALLGLSFFLIANTYRQVAQLAQTPFNFVQSYVLVGGLVFLFALYLLRAVAARERREQAPT